MVWFFFGFFFGGWFSGVFFWLGFPTCLVDRRDRPCLDPLKRDSGRYTITLIKSDLYGTLLIAPWPVRWVEWVTVVGRMAHVQCVQHNVWYNLCSYTMMRSLTDWEYLRRVTCLVFEKNRSWFFFGG